MTTKNYVTKFDVQGVARRRPRLEQGCSDYIALASVLALKSTCFEHVRRADGTLSSLRVSDAHRPDTAVIT
jgi:hypothetical protein